MNIHIALGWYIIPLLLTVGSRLRLNDYNRRNPSGGGAAKAIYELLWLVPVLFVWLIYAACAAIFNIF